MRVGGVLKNGLYEAFFGLDRTKGSFKGLYRSYYKGSIRVL